MLAKGKSKLFSRDDNPADWRSADTLRNSAGVRSTKSLINQVYVTFLDDLTAQNQVTKTILVVRYCQI